MDGTAISLCCLGGVALLTLIDLYATLPAEGATARPRPSAERCPFCHQALEDGCERVRCKGCGTRHHETCWTEHRGCSVFGCGSLEMRRAGGERTPPAGEALGQAVEAAVEARPAEVAADPAG